MKHITSFRNGKFGVRAFGREGRDTAWIPGPCKVSRWRAGSSIKSGASRRTVRRPFSDEDRRVSLRERVINCSKSVPKLNPTLPVDAYSPVHKYRRVLARPRARHRTSAHIRSRLRGGNPPTLISFTLPSRGRAAS